ncbi:hypothetical protein C6Q28_29035 [Burkholderia multivorans]|nr:hypothetical protein C6Q28_29035 [Burkholderia multivorans]
MPVISASDVPACARSARHPRRRWRGGRARHADATPRPRIASPSGAGVSRARDAARLVVARAATPRIARKPACGAAVRRIAPARCRPHDAALRVSIARDARRRA